MSGYQQAEKRIKQSERPVRGSDTHLHWAAAQTHSYVSPANGASQGNPSGVYPGSISQGPPPSFLTRTPLGVRGSEAVDYLARSQTNVSRSQGSRGANISSPINPTAGMKPGRLPPEHRVPEPKGGDVLAQRAPANGMVNRLVKEEIRLSMSKMSIMSLILGFLFLGVLFFIIGFLAAVGTLKSETAVQSSQGVWAATNAPQGQQGPGKGGKDDKGGGFAKLIGKVAGKAVGKELSPFEKMVSGMGKNVPAPLQPFARYGVGSARSQARSTMNAANPFATHRGQLQQPVQPYGGPTQQPYGGQPYPSGAYPSQEMGQPQGAYPQGYGSVQQPMVQQQMPGQPYYPQSPQQMPTQPMGAYGNGYAGQAPYPPQNMMPQQGYYR